MFFNPIASLTAAWLVAAAATVAAIPASSHTTALAARFPGNDLQKRGDAVCDGPQRDEGTRIIREDCRSTIAQFHAVFGAPYEKHPLGSPDWQLPYHFASGTCLISITMTPWSDRVTENASLWDLGSAAALLAAKCLTKDPRVRRGGQITAGDTGSLIITLGYNAPALHFLTEGKQPVPTLSSSGGSEPMDLSTS